MPSHVIQAARRPVNLDECQVNAVAARIELDLRIGAAFTRLQTNSLKTLGGPLKSVTLSYGTALFLRENQILKFNVQVPVSFLHWAL